MSFVLSRKKIIITACIGAVLCIFVFFVLPPRTLRPDTIVKVENGRGSYATARALEEAGIIRSSFLFHIFVKLFGGERSLQAGDYLLSKRITVITLARRMVLGEYGFTARKVTFPEGTSVREMALILKSNLLNFDTEAFITAANDKEGYLFPDTYLIMPTATSGQVIKVMEANFERRLKGIDRSIAAFNKPLKDIITMASIIEEEANDEKSRRVVSGILWKRISNDIALQVDAPFVYLIGKESAELTKDDLKIDSPYNTYKYRGLPPHPITNPGLDAILAAVTPEKSEYLYFLSDEDGKMYYARTYDEHLMLKEKYLK
jgi:UPF0755 protein